MKLLQARPIGRLLTSFVVLSGLACGNEANFASANRRQTATSLDVNPLPVAVTTATDIATQTTTSTQTEQNSSETTTATATDPAIGTSAPGEVVSSDPAPPLPITLEQNFVAARYEDFNIMITPPQRFARQIVTLREKAPTVAKFSQIDRAEQTELFTQGHIGTLLPPEDFVLTRAGLLDLLLVIDDSNSMRNEHQKLAARLASLLSSIGNTDWQMRVITTSDPCPRNNRLITARDADFATAFTSAVQVPIIPYVVEKGLPMAIKGLRGECRNKTTPWLREGSTVAVLILSDEQNCGSPYGDGCPGEEGESPQDMVNYLASIRPAGNARFHAIIEGSGNPCGDEAYEATEYRAVVDATGGAWGSICDADYAQTLQRISANVSRIIERRFELKQIPDSGSVMLSIDGKNLNAGFRIEGRTVILAPDAVRADDQKLQVSYRVGAIPQFDQVTLAQSADPQTVRVFVAGERLAKDEFSYDPMTRDLKLAAMPEDDAKIQVFYRTGLLPKRFSLAGLDILGLPVAVTVDGQMVAFQYDANTMAVDLAETPADGAKILVTHRTASGRITRYPAAFADLVLWPIATDVETGLQLPVLLDGQDITVDADEVVDGRRIELRYQLDSATKDFVYDLGQSPEPGSIHVRDDQGQEICAWQLVGSTVTVRCEPTEAAQISLSYRQVFERFAAFSLPGPFDPERASWQVWVDDVAILDIQRQGHTITIPAELLQIESKVKLAVTYRP